MGIGSASFELDEDGEELSGAFGTAVEVGWMIISGGAPVEPTSPVEDEGTVSLVSGSGANVGWMMDSGRPPVEPTFEGTSKTDVDCRIGSRMPLAELSLEEGTSKADVGWRMGSGRPPVEPTLEGTSKTDVGCRIGSRMPFAELSLVEGTSNVEVGWVSESGTPPVEPTLDEVSSDGVGTGMGGCGVYIEDDDSRLEMPVPTGCEVGTDMVTTSVPLVTVVTLLVRSTDEDDCDCNEKKESQREGHPGNCRDSTFDVLLEDEDEEDEDEDVGKAGVVVLVTICRLTWRGK